jgi:hypothetical protein
VANPGQNVHRARAVFLDAALEVGEAFLLWMRCLARGDPSRRDLETNYLRRLADLKEHAKALNGGRVSEPKP